MLAVANLQKKVDFFIELILILILVISPLLFGSVGPFPVLIIEIAAFLILFLWFFKCINYGLWEFVQLPINIPFLLFLIFIAIQYCFINFLIPDFPLGAIYRQKMRTETLKLISYLIFFYIVLNTIQERRKIKRLINVLICIGFLLSFFGIINKLVQPKTVSAFASFPNRNHFANYINMIIFLTFGVVFSRFPLLRDYIKGLDKGSIVKGLLAMFQEGVWFYIFALIVMSSSLFYSLSRGGIFSFCCGIVFFSALTLLKGITKRGYIFLFAVLVLTLGILLWVNAPEQIAGRFTKDVGSESSFINKLLGARRVLVDKAIELIKDYPLFGVGFGALEFIYNKNYNPKLMYSDIYYYIDHLHNDFLEFFCEVGFIGFIILLTAVCIYVFFIMKVFWKRHDPFVIGLGAGAMAGLFSMCVHSFFDFGLHVTSNAILFFVIAGLAIVITNSQVSPVRHWGRIEGANGVSNGVKEKKEATLLPKGKLSPIKNLYIKALLLFVLLTAFFYVIKSILSPYIAYKISREGKETIASLKEAIRLDPSNDKYHFFLAEFFIEKAKRNIDHAQKYIELASREVKEAMRLNPWNEYYPVYLDWIFEVFNPSIEVPQ